jgi:hypothetical protein
VNYLRSEIRKLIKKLAIQEPMPRPPAIDEDVIKGLGFDQAFAAKIRNTDSLIKEFKELRNAASHFLLDKEQVQPLHISDGKIYREYSNGGALLLFYSHAAVRDLMVFFNQHLYGHLARGTIAILPEDRDRYTIKFDAYGQRFLRPGDVDDEDEEEDEDMSKPMFIKVNAGRTVEFINISHIVRIEITHPADGQPGGGTLYLQDGSQRSLNANEINWTMRMMAGLLGQPAVGTQDVPGDYWTGTQEPTESVGSPAQAASSGE